MHVNSTILAIKQTQYCYIPNEGELQTPTLFPKETPY